MDSKSYYRFEDFLLDDSFKEFLLRSDEKSVKYWEEWIDLHPEVKEEIDRATKVMLTLTGPNKTQVTSDSKEELKKLLKRIHSDEKRNSIIRRLSYTVAKVAAVILICSGVFWMGYHLSTQENIKSQKTSYNEIIVPVGEKSQIILSDGTHVWINSGSRFKYPLSFGLDTRQVILEGEAFFDVTKNRKDFIVTTNDADIRVLGTAFNVKSYPGDQRTQTTVVRGLVKVYSKTKGTKPVLIGPAQMAVINDQPESANTKANHNKLSVIDNVNTLAVTSWKDQLLVFADETFEDLSIKMERWYNMKIRIDDKTLKKERYTGKFVNNETIYQVLEAIAVTTPIKYKVENDEIIITRK